MFVVRYQCSTKDSTVSPTLPVGAPYVVCTPCGPSDGGRALASGAGPVWMITSGAAVSTSWLLPDARAPAAPSIDSAADAAAGGDESVCARGRATIQSPPQLTAEARVVACLSIPAVTVVVFEVNDVGSSR